MARILSAHEVFYPAAALYAVVALPASVLVMTGVTGAPTALRDPALHAHEMLLGFALAVVAGNQLGTVRGRSLAMLLSLWAAARGASLIAPASALAAALNAAFAGTLAYRLVPRLVRSAKKWRNRALPAVLAALCAAAVYWPVARFASGQAVPNALVLVTVTLFAFLMLFMGGRIVAPAVAGQFYRQGERLDARVQPRLEAAILVAAAVVPVALLVPGMRVVAVAAAAATGVLALVRVVRWRLWKLHGRADLVCLAAGYAWLGVGLLVLAASFAAGRYENAAVHVLTIGALGTLTFNVMAMFWMLRARREPGGPLVVWGTVLLAAAVAFRVLGAFHSRGWLVVAAACWTAAFSFLLVIFWRMRRRPRQSLERSID